MRSPTPRSQYIKSQRHQKPTSTVPPLGSKNSWLADAFYEAQSIELSVGEAFRGIPPKTKALIYAEVSDAGKTVVLRAVIIPRPLLDESAGCKALVEYLSGGVLN